eukprot:TRINITY_DN3090_c0_g2_i9.p1 TRINITY_DN3090_c0_g2~~TRINITY_DN3090_c0_g2_i9.p1  ORF type:complete len:272 (+),score=-22.25 TRINITY_DN3090_c0_g2_i9:282-1097(+)
MNYHLLLCFIKKIIKMINFYFQISSTRLKLNKSSILYPTFNTFQHLNFIMFDNYDSREKIITKYYLANIVKLVNILTKVIKHKHRIQPCKSTLCLRPPVCAQTDYQLSLTRPNTVNEYNSTIQQLSTKVQIQRNKITNINKKKSTYSINEHTLATKKITMKVARVPFVQETHINLQATIILTRFVKKNQITCSGNQQIRNVYSKKKWLLRMINQVDINMSNHKKFQLPNQYGSRNFWEGDCFFFGLDLFLILVKRIQFMLKNNRFYSTCIW